MKSPVETKSAASRMSTMPSYPKSPSLQEAASQPTARGDEHPADLRSEAKVSSEAEEAVRLLVAYQAVIETVADHDRLNMKVADLPSSTAAGNRRR